jgi:hypothetical protein
MTINPTTPEIVPKETGAIFPIGVVEATLEARNKLLLNTHDNVVKDDETSHQYIKRKWHGYCVQAGIIAARSLVENHLSDYEHILLLASHSQEGSYVGKLGDEKFTGHMVCICQDKHGKWASLSPTTYAESSPEDTTDSIFM